MKPTSKKGEPVRIIPPTTCPASLLVTLSEMWLEGAKVCEMIKTPGWNIEKSVYEECARDLLDVLAGKLDCIEEVNPKQNEK